MRTQEEIMARMKEIEAEDIFGFESTDLLLALELSNAKQYFLDSIEHDEESWAERRTTDPVVQIKDYMPFAWEKANGCRGLSAGRSISHMRAWCWLHGDEAMEAFNKYEYEFYGKPILVAICEFFEIDWKVLDSGLWGNSETVQEPRDDVWQQ